MFHKTLFAPLLAASAMALALATPAHAGKADRAREAIAAADAKIYTAESMGAGSEMPQQTADARAALATAKEKLSAGHKSTSIKEAIRASSLADAAIGEMQMRQQRTLADERQARTDSVAAAQQQTALAQQQAASAQQSAAISAGEATAARNQAIAPAQVQTTVTTEQPARLGTRPTTKTTVTRHTTKAVAAPTAGVTTTTTVTRPER